MSVPVKNIYKICLQGTLAGMMFTIKSNYFIVMLTALLLGHVKISLIKALKKYQICNQNWYFSMYILVYT